MGRGHGARAGGTVGTAGLLLSLWSAMACGGTTTEDDDASSSEDSVGSAPQPTAPVESGPAGPSIDPPSNDLPSSNDPPPVDPRLDTLFQGPEWEVFRELWLELDAIEPNGSESSPYQLALSAERAEELALEFDGALRDLESTGLLQEQELSFLRQLVGSRLEYLEFGDFAWVMHSMPPPFFEETGRSLHDLEAKVDVLEALRASCQLDADTYGLALRQVEQEAISAFVLGQLKTSTQAFWTYVDPEIEGADLIEEIENQLAVKREEAGENPLQLATIDEMTERLELAKGMLESIPVLVGQLERCD